VVRSSQKDLIASESFCCRALSAQCSLRPVLEIRGPIVALTSRVCDNEGGLQSDACFNNRERRSGAILKLMWLLVAFFTCGMEQSPYQRRFATGGACLPNVYDAKHVCAVDGLSWLTTAEVYRRQNHTDAGE